MGRDKGIRSEKAGKDKGQPHSLDGECPWSLEFMGAGM